MKSSFTWMCFNRRFRQMFSNRKTLCWGETGNNSDSVQFWPEDKEGALSISHVIEENRNGNISLRTNEVVLVSVIFQFLQCFPPSYSISVVILLLAIGVIYFDEFLELE